MSEPALLYVVGATKAGTSWLYRALHDHPDCAPRAVKEAHYWDTFDAESRAKQLIAFNKRLFEYQASRAEAQAQERQWQVANMDRRIADMTGLIAAIAGDRTGDAAYRRWLTDGTEGRLPADMTPGYSVLPVPMLERMAALSPRALFVFLIREPLARLWSHIRMQAERFRQAHEVFEEKANNILWRILHKGQETHILERGDYPATVARLRAAVPAARLHVAYCERLFTQAGFAEMCAFLGIRPLTVDGTERVHEGPRATMRDDLRPKAVRLLRGHYDWAAREVGPLPQAWADNLARGAA